MSSPIGHKKFRFYSKWAGEPLNGCEQGTWLKILKVLPIVGEWTDVWKEEK